MTEYRLMAVVLPALRLRLTNSADNGGRETGLPLLTRLIMLGSARRPTRETRTRLAVPQRLKPGDFRLGPHRQPLRGRQQVSYAVNSTTDTFSPDRDHRQHSARAPLRSVRLKALWANSCFVATMGDSTLEAVNAMSRSDAGSEPNPDLLMAEARGFAGDF